MREARASSLLKASLLPLIIIYWLLPSGARAFLDAPCLITTLLGVNCPGCGMKTAIVQLLGLDWRSAMTTNALSPAALATIGWVSLGEILKLLSNGGVTRDRVFDNRAANDDERAFA